MIARFLTLVLGASLVASCSEARPVPQPDLTGVEPEIKAKIERCRAAVIANRSVETWSALARTLHTHDKHEGAEQAYLAAAELASGVAAFEHWHLAAITAFDRSPERARDYLERALSLRTDVMATHLHLAILEERQERWVEARRRYAHVASQWKSAHAELGLGRVALNSGDPKLALQHLRRARELDGRIREVHEALARTHARLGNRDAGRAAAQRAGDMSESISFADPLLAKVAREDVQAATLFRQGRELAQAGDEAAAIEKFRTGLAGRPNDLGARYYFAALLGRAKRVEECIEQAGLVLAQEAQHRGALELRARVLIAVGRRGEALPDLRKLVAIDPNHAWARAELAR